MASDDDLAALRALIAAEPEVDSGLDDYCLLVAEAASFGTWTDAPPRLGEPFAEDGSEHEFCLVEGGAVMLYTPLSDTPYVVVGADLREFLALLLHGNGARIGRLGYDLAGGVAELETPLDPDDEISDEEALALQRLVERFGLTRWPAVGPRIEELQALLPAA